MVAGTKFARKTSYRRSGTGNALGQRAKKDWFALGDEITNFFPTCGNYSQEEKLFWKILDENGL